jgi:hypothetical protein
MSGGEVVIPKLTVRLYLLSQGLPTTKPPPCQGVSGLQYNNTAVTRLLPPVLDVIGFHPASRWCLFHESLVVFPCNVYFYVALDPTAV